MEGVGGVEFVGVGEVRDVTDRRGDVIVVIGKGLDNEGDNLYAGWRLKV